MLKTVKYSYSKYFNRLRYSPTCSVEYNMEKTGFSDYCALIVFCWSPYWPLLTRATALHSPALFSSFHIPFANNSALFISVITFCMSNFGGLICRISLWIATGLLTAVRMSCCSEISWSFPRCRFGNHTSTTQTIEITTAARKQHYLSWLKVKLINL